MGFNSGFKGLRKIGSMPPLPPYAFMERRLMTVTFVDRNMRVVDNAMWQSAFEARSFSYPANFLPLMEVEGFCRAG